MLNTLIWCTLDHSCGTDVASCTIGDPLELLSRHKSADDLKLIMVGCVEILKTSLLTTQFKKFCEADLVLSCPTPT